MGAKEIPILYGWYRYAGRDDWTIKKEFEITNKGYEAAKKYMDHLTKDPGEFDLQNHNCTTVTMELAKQAGINHPDPTFKGEDKQYKGDPGTLGKQYWDAYWKYHKYHQGPDPHVTPNGPPPAD